MASEMGEGEQLMSSISNPQIIKTVLENDGVFPGDPRYYSVFHYINMWGGNTYKLCRDAGERKNFMLTGCFEWAEEMWLDGKMSDYGKLWLKERNEADTSNE